MHRDMQEGLEHREKIDHQMVKAIKEEIMADLKAQKELKENYYPGFRRRAGRDLERDMRQNHSNNAIRDEVLKELRAVQDVENRLGRLRNPRTRELVRELLEKAEEKGMTASDLVQSISATRPTLRDRLSGMLFNPQNRLPLGVGAVLLGLFLFPAARGSLRPLARKVVEEVMNMSEKTQTVIARAQEDLSDIVAEAQFARLADSVQQATENHIPGELGGDSELH